MLPKVKCYVRLCFCSPQLSSQALIRGPVVTSLRLSTHNLQSTDNSNGQGLIKQHFAFARAGNHIFIKATFNSWIRFLLCYVNTYGILSILLHTILATKTFGIIYNKITEPSSNCLKQTVTAVLYT